MPPQGRSLILPQNLGAITLGADDLQLPDLISVINGGPRGAAATLLSLAQFFAQGGSMALTPYMFGAKGDGVTNDTIAFQAFLTALSNGGVANWSGKWIVDRGVLTLTPSPNAPNIANPSKLFEFYAPSIYGDATFTFSGTGTGPLLTIKNPDLTPSKSGQYAGGILGNMHFFDKSNSQAIDQHGVVMRGLVYWHFGMIEGYALPGSTVYFSRDTDMGDPDPYSVAECVFLLISADFCNAVAWDANSGLNDGGNKIFSIRSGGTPASGVVNDNGVLNNSGGGSQIMSASIGATLGWGVHFSAAAGAFEISARNMELGAPENGIWIESMDVFDIQGRVELSFKSAGLVWPQTMLKIGGHVPAKATQNGKIELIFRIDSGTLQDLGDAPFIDLSNEPNIGNVDITIHLIDNAGMGVTGANGALAIPVSQFVANLNPDAGVTIRVNGALIVNQLSQTAASIRIAANANDATIPDSGFGTAAARLTGTWSISNGPNAYNLIDQTTIANFNYVFIPATAQYNLNLQMIIPVGGSSGQVTAGSIVKYAIVQTATDGTTVIGNVVEGTEAIVSANGYHVITQNVVAKTLAANTRLFIALEIGVGQNGTCKLTFFTDPSASNFFQIEACPRD